MSSFVILTESGSPYSPTKESAAANQRARAAVDCMSKLTVIPVRESRSKNRCTLSGVSHPRGLELQGQDADGQLEIAPHAL